MTGARRRAEHVAVVAPSTVARPTTDMLRTSASTCEGDSHTQAQSDNQLCGWVSAGAHSVVRYLYLCDPSESVLSISITWSCLMCSCCV